MQKRQNSYIIHWILMLVTVVVTSIIVSCSGNPAVDRQLAVAENMMEERPDSALSVLNGIDTELVTSEAEKARYALLMSQALDKNYIDTTTFDVLQPAIDYYINKDKGTPDEKLKTLYYQGRIYQNIPDFDMAMQTFLKANDFKNECRDSLTYAHMLVAQSVLYFSSYQLEDYVSSSLMAAELYDKLNNDRYQQSSLIKALDGSIALGNRQLSDSIMPLVDSLAQYVPDYQEERLLVKQTYLISSESDSAIKSLLDTVSDYSMMNDESRLNIANGYYISIKVILGTAALLVGCSESNTVFNEPEAIRAYETDAQIMARFVEVDRTTGTFVLNPDKKITVSDYLLNSGREELMTVSQINRNRFIKEMEAVNRLLSAVKRSGGVSAFVYSTLTSNVVIDGDDNDSFYISKLNEDYYSHGRVASLSLEEGKSRSASFFAQSDMVMTVNIGNCSTFYCAQVSLGNQSNSDSKIVFISGVRSFIPTHNYRLVAPSILDNNKTLSGIILIGGDNVTVSIAR